MRPNIPENPRRRDTTKPKCGHPRHFDQKPYANRFTVERTFGWEDTYRSLVTRYDRKQADYRGRKTLAYTLINLRYFVGSRNELHTKELLTEYDRFVYFIDKAPWHLWTRKVRSFFESHKDRIIVREFPTGCPEMNPVEHWLEEGKV